MASLRTSMNLESSHRGLATDGKSFVFVVQNVPLHLPTEDVQSILTKELGTDVKIYRAFNKTHVFLTVFGKPCEEKLNQTLESGNGSHHFEVNFETI